MRLSIYDWRPGEFEIAALVFGKRGRTGSVALWQVHRRY